MVVYQSAPWRSDRGCGVFWGAWQDRATVRSKPGLCLGSNFSMDFSRFFSSSESSILKSSLFSMYQIQGQALDLNIFVPRRNDTTYLYYDKTDDPGDPGDEVFCFGILLVNFPFLE